MHDTEPYIDAAGTQANLNSSRKLTQQPSGNKILTITQSALPGSPGPGVKASGDQLNDAGSLAVA